MNMTGKRSFFEEERLRTESLRGVPASDERARSVMTNVRNFIACKERLNKEEKAGKTNKKLEEILSNCYDRIKQNMIRLGADEECIETMKTFVDKNDEDSAQLLLLKVLFKRNPEMYGRELVACQAKINQK